MKKRSVTNTLVNLTGLLLISLAIFIGCKKNDSGFSNAAPPDLVTKIKSSVSGFVTDENNLAVKNASVQFGTTTILTDKYGYFEAKNIAVVKDAATVTITKPGYFKGIKTFIATAGKGAFFRIKLIPKTIAGTVNGSSGGTVTLSNGLSVTLPVNGVINATTNTAYTGIVNVAAYWINPASNDLPQIMPGDLRGINTDGNAKLLSTYGMAAVELTSSSGELLQIAPGKKAGLSLPLPSSILSSAPATIPLWYFDEALGLWKEEGSATKNGNYYTGEVSHFSFWNCDMPASYVPFNCTIVNTIGQPVPNIMVKISVVSNPSNTRFGYTDSAGYVYGLVPDNAQLVLEVLNISSCTVVAYSQTFVTGTVAVSLGNITLPAAITATVSGTVTNCNDNPVTNGYVVVLDQNQSTRYNVDNTGSFSFTKIVCPAPVILIGEDIATLQQSNSLNLMLTTGANNVGILKACGINASEFFYYSIHGVNYLLTKPQDSIIFSGIANNPEGWVYAYEKTALTHNAMVQFKNYGTAVNSYQDLAGFNSTKLTPSNPVAPYILLHITEYGPVGQFISGNFSDGNFRDTANILHKIACSFRARRRE